jgi:phosphocarrier protein
MVNNTATRTVKVQNSAGLHARPSLAIVQAVRGSKSTVEITTPSQTINAGDILQILGLGATQGTELVLSANGPDAETILNKLVDLFNNCFGVGGEPE